MIHIQTPATTANMGPGFDCIGMALQMYNHLWVEERESGLLIQKKRVGMRVPCDERNLIYMSMMRFFSETGFAVPFSGLRLVQEDDIPQTRGLGSSAACIVSGLAAANVLSGGKLSKQELAEMASMLEGHPDNATPAVLGGMVVGVMRGDGKLECIKLDTAPMVRDGMRFGVMVPDFPLQTLKVRKVLPQKYAREDVVFNASRAALLVAAILTSDYEKLAVAMEDRVHQPYRQSVIPGMPEIFAEARALGAKGVYLSGAGPTLIAVYDSNEVRSGLAAFLRTMQNKWMLLELMPDIEGVQVKHEPNTKTVQ